ncbi:hypothetical protein DFH09DRAFT_1067518 [Mycena vulgaris]|nr:hypothetical protein DFH09DRAFT_1067518 [Mycena vulgaris]
MHRPSHILQQRQGPDSNQDLPRFTSFLSTTIAGVEAAAIGSPVPGSVANSRGEFTGIKTWKTVREMEGAHRSLGQTRYRKLTLQCGGWESEGMESEKERVSLRSIAYGWEVQDIDSCADVPAMLGWTFETPGCASRALTSLPDSRCPDCSRLWQAIICDTRRWNGNRTNKRKPHKAKARIRTKTLGVGVHSLDETEKLRGRESAEVEHIETHWEWRNWRVDVDSIRVVHLVSIDSAAVRERRRRCMRIILGQGSLYLYAKWKCWVERPTCSLQHRYTLRRPLRRSRREEAQAESVELSSWDLRTTVRDPKMRLRRTDCGLFKTPVIHVAARGQGMGWEWDEESTFRDINFPDAISVPSLQRKPSYKSNVG